MQSYLTLAVAVLVAQSLGLARGALSVVAEPVAQSLGLSSTQLGLLFGFAFAVPFVVAAPMWGWLADRVSRRNLLIAAVLLWGVATLLASMASSFETLLAARALVGIASAGFFPVAISMVTDAHLPREHGRALGILYAGIGLSPGFAAASIGTLYAWAQTSNGGGLEAWRLAFVAVAMVSLPAAALLAFVREPARQERQPLTNASAGPVAMNPALLGSVFACVALLSVVDESNLSWLATVYTRHFGYAPAKAGWTLGLIAAVAGGLGPVVGGTIADRLYRRFGVAGRLVACGAACACLVPAMTGYLSEDARIATAALAFGSLCLAAALTVGMVILQESMPGGSRGLATGLVFSAIALAASAGPILVAFVAERSSLRLALVYVTVPLSAMAVAAVASAWLFLRRIPAGSTVQVAAAAR